MNETGREFYSIWHRYCGYVSECPYLLEILHEIFRDKMSWSLITLEWLPKKQINTFYMCRKRWRWQNGHCWSWAVSTCVFNVQFFLLPFMFESTYHKKLNKQTKKPYPRTWPLVSLWAGSAQSWKAGGSGGGCLSGLYGTWSYQHSPGLSGSPLSKASSTLAEKGSGSWVQYPCCHPPATRPWPLWVSTSLCKTRTIIVPDS